MANEDPGRSQLGNFVAQYMVRRWTSGSWSLPAVLAIATGFGAVFLLTERMYVATIAAAGLSAIACVWLLQSLRIDKVVECILVYESGVVLKYAGEAVEVPFRSIVGLREETLFYGFGPWNREKVLWLVTESGDEFRIGREVDHWDEVSEHIRKNARNVGNEVWDA